MTGFLYCHVALFGGIGNPFEVGAWKLVELPCLVELGLEKGEDMKRRWIGFGAVLLVMLSVNVAQAGWFDGFKAGGTLLYNDAARARFETTGVGIHVSADIRPPGFFMISPFYEVAAAKPSTQLVGGAVSWAVAMRDHRTHIFYFGGSYGLVIADGASERMYGLHIGYKFPLNERMGLFAQIKGVEADNQAFQGIVASVGVNFALWGNFTEEE